MEFQSYRKLHWGRNYFAVRRFGKKIRVRASDLPFFLKYGLWTCVDSGPRIVARTNARKTDIDLKQVIFLSSMLLFFGGSESFSAVYSGIMEQIE